MAGSPGIFPKNDGDTIYAADYNNIQSATQFLLGAGLADSGYGQAVGSSQVAGPPTSTKVTVAQWNALRTDLLKIRQHQTGVDESANLTVPTTSLTINNEFANEYKNYANTCNTNRLVIASNQGTETNLFTPAERTSSWNGKITHTVTITFADSNQARYYFNAGGQFRFSASRSGGDATDKNSSWTTLLSDMATITFGSSGTTYSGSGANTVATSTGWYQLTTSDQTVFVKPAAAGVYNENEYRIKVRKNANDNTATILYFTIEFDDVDSGDQRPYNPSTPPGPGADGTGSPGPGQDEDVNTGSGAVLTSTVKIFRPTGSNVEVTAPSFTQSGI